MGEAFSVYSHGEQLLLVINVPSCLNSSFIVSYNRAAEAGGKSRESSCHIPSIPEVSALHANKPTSAPLND